MNERIFELGKQATIWCCDNLNQDTPREDWDAAWEQKFADLIAAAVISKAEDYGLGCDAVEQLKEDFGVEE